MYILGKKIQWDIRTLFRREFISMIGVTVGTLIMCFGVAAFIEPYRFASAGVMGISLLITYVTGYSPVWFMTAVNVLLLIWGWKALSPRFALWTAYVTVLTSFFYPLCAAMPHPVMENRMIAAAVGGVITGLGVGLMFRFGGSSGGMDIAAAVLRKTRGINIGTASMFINAAILLGSCAVVNFESVALGAFSLYVESQVIDQILLSTDKRMRLMIITNKPKEIAGFIIEELDRTATFMHSRGAYSGQEFDVVMVIVTLRQSTIVRRKVRELDPRAFITLDEVSEVLGEGFKNLSDTTEI